MALPTINASDFVGEIKLTQNTFRTNQLNEYISFYYPQIVSDLIGEAALQEIEEAVILPQKYIDLLQGSGVYFNSNFEQFRKKPKLIDLVKRIIFFHWVRDYSINTPAGDVKNKSENATSLNRHEIASNARQRFNWSIRRFNDRVIPFVANYCDIEGDVTTVNILGGGVLEIITPNTLYLQDGDDVTIEGEEYVVSNLVDNVSFEITSNVIPTSYTYNPFSSLVIKQQDPVLF